MSQTNPEWIDEIIEALEWTEGVDEWTRVEKDGETIFTIKYGVETFQFTARNDGESKGAAYDGGVHNLTDSEEMQWWISCQIYDRFQKSKQRIAELEAALAETADDLEKMHAWAGSTVENPAEKARAAIAKAEPPDTKHLPV